MVSEGDQPARWEDTDDLPLLCRLGICYRKDHCGRSGWRLEGEISASAEFAYIRYVLWVLKVNVNFSFQ